MGRSAVVITIQLEPYEDCIDEMRMIYPEHYEELSRTKQKPLNPMYDVYMSLAKSGNIKVIAVRDEGKLIGYLIFMLSPDLHYGGIIATEDIYYLKREYRGKMIGVRLFGEFEREAKKFGAWKMVVSTKIHSDNAVLLKRVGMVDHEKIFVKVL